MTNQPFAAELEMIGLFTVELARIIAIPLDAEGTLPDVPTNKTGRKLTVEIDDFFDEEDGEKPSFGVVFQPWGQSMNEIRIDYMPTFQGGYIPVFAMYSDESGFYDIHYHQGNESWPDQWNKSDDN